MCTYLSCNLAVKKYKRIFHRQRWKIGNKRKNVNSNFVSISKLYGVELTFIVDKGELFHINECVT